MKKTLIGVISVLVLGAAGYALFAYLSTPKVLSSTSEPVVACIDVDGNDIYKANETAYTYVGEPVDGPGLKRGIADYCDYYPDGKTSSSGILRETYCLNGQLVTEKVNCGLGSVCRHGQCVKGGRDIPVCSDSDGGVNAAEKGIVDIGGVSTHDECYFSTNSAAPEKSGGMTDKCSGPTCYTYEYSCEGTERGKTIVPSPNGCVNGVKK